MANLNYLNYLHKIPIIFQIGFPLHWTQISIFTINVTAPAVKIHLMNIIVSSKQMVLGVNQREQAPSDQKFFVLLRKAYCGLSEANTCETNVFSIESWPKFCLRGGRFARQWSGHNCKNLVHTFAKVFFRNVPSAISFCQPVKFQPMYARNSLSDSGPTIKWSH